MMRKFLKFFLFSMMAIVITWPVPAQSKVIADHLNKVYHREDCKMVKKIKERNVRFIDSEAEADAKGYFPCEQCIPPVRQPSMPDPQIKKLSMPLARETVYLGDRQTQEYHQQWCPLLEKTPKNKLIRFQSAKEAGESGFAPCKECNPPVMFNRNPVTIPEETDATEKEKAPSKEDALPEAAIEE